MNRPFYGAESAIGISGGSASADCVGNWCEPARNAWAYFLYIKRVEGVNAGVGP